MVIEDFILDYEEYEMYYDVKDFADVLTEIDFLFDELDDRIADYEHLLKTNKKLIIIDKILGKFFKSSDDFDYQKDSEQARNLLLEITSCKDKYRRCLKVINEANHQEIMKLVFFLNDYLVRSINNFEGVRQVVWDGVNGLNFQATYNNYNSELDAFFNMKINEYSLIKPVEKIKKM